MTLPAGRQVSKFKAMRIIFILLLGCLLNQHMTAQVESPRKQIPQKEVRRGQPSKDQMQEQMKEALNEARQQVIALNEQIAEAKANKEDPESIKEMEKQLATVTQMVAMLERTNLPGKPISRTLPPSKKVEPKYVSPFESIVLKQPITPPTKDKATDQLFWYKGKKVDPHTIVTPGRTVVRYDRPNNRLIFQPDRLVDSPDNYYGFVKALAQTPQMRNDYVIAVDNRLNSFFMYPEIQKAYDEFYFLRDRLSSIAKNSIKMTPRTGTLEIFHHELVVKMATLPTHRNMPLPPKRPNSMCDCDKGKRISYEQDLIQWLQIFCKDENGLLELLEGIYLNINSGGAQGYASLASIPNLRADIVKAFDLVLERLPQKVEELSNKYQQFNVHIEDGLVLVTKYLQKLLFQTFSDVDEQSTINLKRNAHSVIDQVKNSVLSSTVFEKHIEDQKAALNFNEVLDYALYANHELNKKALKMSIDVRQNLMNWFDKLDKFNRFALQINFVFQYEQIDPTEQKRLLEASGNLKSDRIIVRLGRDECSWHLYHAYPDHRDNSGTEEPFEIPINVLSGVKKIYTNTGAITLPYTGPDKMNMVFPTFKIDLCFNAANDRVYMDVLRYSDADLAAYPNQNFGTHYTTDMMQFTNKMFIMAKKVKDDASNVVSIGLEMMNISNMTTGPPSTGNSTLDKIMMEYIMNQRKVQLQTNLSQTTHSGKTAVPFDAKNRESVLIRKTHSLVDPADQDQTWGMKMTFSNVTIEVTHSPL